MFKNIEVYSNGCMNVAQAILVDKDSANGNDAAERRGEGPIPKMPSLSF